MITMGITGAMKTTPNIALDSITELLPLHLHIMTEAMKTHIRMASNGLWRQGNKPRKCMTGTITSRITDLDPIDTDLTITRHNMNKQYDHTYAPTGNYETTTQSEILCHTDAISLHNEEIKSGATCKMLQYNKIYLSDNQTSNVNEEMSALIDLCTSLSQPATPKLPIKITCGNDGTIRALTATKSNSKIANECIDKLNGLAANCKVTIELRNNTTTMEDTINILQTDTIPTRTNNLRPYKSLKRQIDDWAKDQHLTEFINYKGGQSTKANIITPYSQKLRNMCRRSRNDLRLLTQILTGHAWLNKHLHNMKLSNTPICPLCKSGVEDIQHFMYECTELHTIRLNTFGQAITLETMPISSMEHGKIIEYCKATERLHFEPNTL